MSTIQFTFEDLCAFFTRYRSRFMVGMIETGGEAPENVHQPRITIRQNGVIKREYRGFAEVNGDIFFDVYPKGKPLSRSTLHSARHPHQRFGLFVDIEKDLYPGQPLHPDAQLCRARLHFRNGELHALDRLDNVRFADAETNQPCPQGPLSVASKVGLKVEVEEGGYAVLHFSGETEDFVFKGGQDYEVEVINQAEAIRFDHFRYFYNIVQSKPEQKWIPVSAQSLELPVPSTGGRPLCLIGAFGKAAYILPRR